MLFLLNSDYGAMKKTFEVNHFLDKVSASRHKMSITAIFTHIVLELCKNKYLRDWSTLTLETRIGYICNTHAPRARLSRRGLWWSWNEAYSTFCPDTASWCARNSCKKHYSNCFYLRFIDI